MQDHYRALWELGVPIDVIDMEQDFSRYKLLVAPMLYMVRPGVGERIQQFVEAGGTFVATYWSGIVDEFDLCFLGGFPGPLRKTLGVWSEEIDALHDHDVNGIVTNDGGGLAWPKLMKPLSSATSFIWRRRRHWPFTHPIFMRDGLL